jgi:hypothetical protein
MILTRDPILARAMLADALACSVVGGPKTVRHGLQAFIASTTADELKVTAQIFDYDTRKRSFEILARVYGETAEMGEYDDPRGASFSVPVGKPRLDCVGALASGNSDRRPIYCGYQSPCRCGGIFCDLSPPSFQPSVTAPPPSTPIVAKAVEWTMG